MMWRRRSDARTRAREAARAVAEQAERVAEMLKERSSDVLDRRGDLAHQAREIGSVLAEKGQHLGERLKERSADLAELGGEIAATALERGETVGKAALERGETVGKAALERGETVGKAAVERGETVGKAALERGSEIGEALQHAVGSLAERLPRRGEGRRKEHSMIGKIFNRFTLGFAAGYVLGARAGRERYEQIVRGWNSFVGNPKVQGVAERGKEMVVDMGRTVGQEIQSRMDRQTIGDIMTTNPRTVKSSEPVKEAARAMREVEAGAMVVVDDSDRVVGILTDRDIAIRSIAEGKDPQSTPVSSIASMDVTSVSPSDSLREAARLMREKAVRRLPVVEGGRAVGIVSIGDLAIERDPDSALADISAQPPNTGAGKAKQPAASSSKPSA